MLGAGVAALVTAAITAAALTHGYVVLAPDLSHVKAYGGFLLGTAVMASTASAILYLSRTTASARLVTVAVFGFVACLFGSFLGSGLFADLTELSAFRRGEFVEFDAFLRVSRFYQTHDRESHYHLALSDFRPRLDLYVDDYRWNAGTSEFITVTGKCIRVHLERSGQALRMIQPEHVRAVPCPANPKLLQLG